VPTYIICPLKIILLIVFGLIGSPANKCHPAYQHKHRQQFECATAATMSPPVSSVVAFRFVISVTILIGPNGPVAMLAVLMHLQKDQQIGPCSLSY
jgi:hypothetical protein